MKRSVVIGVTALIAGLLLAITAFAAPFRDYDRAAGDQYTTTNTTPTNTTGATVTVGQTVTVGSAVAGASNSSNGPTVPAGTATTPVSGQGGPTGGSDEDEGAGVAPDDDAGSGAPDEDDGSGAAPDEDSGAGAPLGNTGAANGGSGSGRGSDRSNYAFLSIDVPDIELSRTVTSTLGVPVWSGILDGLDVNAVGDAAAGTRFAGLGEGDVDVDNLRGFARLQGGDIVGGAGLSSRLPDLLAAFEGKTEPIDGLILARKRLTDADARLLAETFQRAFGRGAVLEDIPVIGVELNGTDRSSIPYFKKIKGISTIDDVNTKRGRQSLVRLMAGAKVGHYGRRESASAAQPPRISPSQTSNPILDGGGSLSGSPLLVGLLLTMALFGGRALVTVMQRSRA